MENYNTVTRIGNGTCGAVFLVRQKKTKKLYAMKQIQLDERKKTRTKEAVMREAKILSELKHPYIVAYQTSFFDEEMEHLLILQDYCDGGTLDDKIIEVAQKNEHFPEEQIIKWFFQITMAVEYMHSKKILHRDLKTQNVFTTKTGKTCKLGDFGIAKILDTTIDVAKTCVGTPMYLAPEMCQDIPYTSKADIWALGCLLHEMCSLKPPFDAPNLINLFYKIIRAEYQPLPSHYSTALLGVVEALLVKSPDERPSARQVLNLPYVKDMLSKFIEGTEYKIQLKALASVRDPPSKDLLGSLQGASGKDPVREQDLPAKDDSPQTATHNPPVLVAGESGDSKESEVITPCNSECGTTPRQQTDSGIAVKEARVLQCGLCGKTFRLKSWLNKHTRLRRCGRGDNDTDYSWSSDDEDDQHVTTKPDPADQCTADYDDDFERLSVSSVDSLCDDDEEIPEELPPSGHGSDDSNSDAEEVLEEENLDDYADDFEEYDSDEDLDEIVSRAKAVHSGRPPSQDVVMDDAPNEFVASCKVLLEEHCIASLGKEKYNELTQRGGAGPDLRQQGASEAGRHEIAAELLQTCYLVNELMVSGQPT
ncbi:hypothetical protein LSAT2_030495 [Lamellibrachia satsuma]|nr:hypothetical protein LSAT2_030495 [Lamellibrachia satsuma]